jgi:hypothetical protein
MQESTHTLVSSLYMAHAYDHVHRKCIQVQIDMCMNMHMLIYKCPSPFSYIVLTFAFPSNYDFVMMASCFLYEFNMCPSVNLSSIFSQECDIKYENYDVFTMWISHMIMLLQNSWGLSSQIRSCSSNCEQTVHSTLWSQLKPFWGKHCLSVEWTVCSQFEEHDRICEESPQLFCKSMIICEIHIVNTS